MYLANSQNKQLTFCIFNQLPVQCWGYDLIGRHAG